MTSSSLPWIELTVLLPLAGAALVRFVRDADRARHYSLWISGVTLVCATCAWLSLHTQGLTNGMASEQWGWIQNYLGREVLVIDEFSAPLLPLAALLYLMVELATLRTKVRRFAFAAVLLRESILLATFSCKQPWVIACLLAAGIVPVWMELRERQKPTRVFTLHMGLFLGLLFAGLTLQTFAAGSPTLFALASVLLMLAILLRSGLAPLHCWMTDLFEHASFGTALLFVTPMVGAYAAVRLVLPFAPDWVLRSLALLSLFTAVYAAGMALVQQEARRFFCYVFLSHSSLVLVGMELADKVGLTGALCGWLSVGLSLAGFGLTLRSVEARRGRLSLGQFHGLYEHMPMLAILFLVTGLSSIGFPGTLGFVGTELLIDGAVKIYPLVGTAIVVAGALNGLAVLQAYFRVFTGARHMTSIDLRMRPPERIAMLVFTLLILGGGIFPQPGVESRYEAAVKLMLERESRVHAPAASERRADASGLPGHL